MKTKVTLSVEEDVWLAFRAECVKRKVQASGVVEEMMQGRLKAWGVEVEEEPKRKTRK